MIKRLLCCCLQAEPLNQEHQQSLIESEHKDNLQFTYTSQHHSLPPQPHHNPTNIQKSKESTLGEIHRENPKNKEEAPAERKEEVLGEKRDRTIKRRTSKQKVKVKVKELRNKAKSGKLIKNEKQSSSEERMGEFNPLGLEHHCSIEIEGGHRKYSSPRGDEKINSSAIIHKYIKSHLWSEKAGSDLIYMNLNKSNQIYMNYRLLRIRESKTPTVLDYFLQKDHSYLMGVIGKETMIYPRCDTLDRFSSKIINLLLTSRLQDDKVRSSEFIIMDRVSGIRWEEFDQILVLTEGLHNYQEVSKYIDAVLKSFTWSEMKKTTYIFPSFMSLEEISLLLFANMKRYIVGLNLESISVDLSFEMELIDAQNLDSAIIVKNRLETSKKAQAVYDQIKVSMGFFGKNFSLSSTSLYRNFFRLIRETSLKNFFALKDKYEESPRHFRRKVKEMQKLNPDEYSNIEKLEDLHDRPCDVEGYYYSIPNEVRKQIGEFFNVKELQRNEIDTPVRKDWDEDAKAEDFRVNSKAMLDEITEAELCDVNMIDEIIGVDGADEDYGILQPNDLGEDNSDFDEMDMILMNDEEVREETSEEKDSNDGRYYGLH